MEIFEKVKRPPKQRKVLVQIIQKDEKGKPILSKAFTVYNADYEEVYKICKEAVMKA